MRKRNSGQSLTEYLAILGLLILVCVTVMKVLGGNMKAGFEKSGKHVEEWFADSPASGGAKPAPK